MAVDRLSWEKNYQEGPRPWDTGLTPPEVEAFWASGRLPTKGLALDIGCGPGTNVAYLAKLGLRALGVDLAGSALTLAQARLSQRQPALLPRIAFAQADVTALPFHQLNATYILDIGCLHGLPPAVRAVYAAGVIDNLAPGGYYQLYAFDSLAELVDDPVRRLRGMGETEVESLFAPHLQVVEIIRARPDRYPCRWYLLRK
ncbi:MAG: class I SAM-dependent methyltransferase [Caldilineaceae bacterium]|nr:class I SAM-dependent methyltransferase [Caldilineaceae bacterium]